MGKTVFISAGHSESDPGCIANGHKESELTEYLRDRIAVNLRGLNVRVVTDGAPGVNLPRQDAIQLARENKGPSVEVHFNSSVSSKSTGVEVLANPELKPLAMQLAAAVSAVLQIPLRGVLGWKLPSSGQHPRLGFCLAGGAILEVCFMNNSAELNKYLFNDEAVAVAIAKVLATAANT